MHIASPLVKCHLHHFSAYALLMAGEPYERLEAARIAAGYDSAKAAAEAMGVPVASYIQHENGTRGLTNARAARYARFFKTTPEWLLYARKGGGDPSVNDLESMIEAVLSELVTFETRLGDLPRIVAPSLHEQIERFRVDRTTPPPSPSGRSLPATKRGGKGAPRNS